MVFYHREIPKSDIASKKFQGFPLQTKFSVGTGDSIEDSIFQALQDLITSNYDLTTY
jgi:hypothetical protein